MKRPHIILFNPDQFRGDALHHLGNPASHTPHLDQLAQEDGVSMRNAFCQNPVCTPSRCSFMTGWYPHVHGHRTMHHMLRRPEPVLLKTLKDNGYYVWWGGKNDLVPKDRVAECCDVRYQPPAGSGRYNLHAIHDWRGDRNGDNWFSFLKGRLDVPEGETCDDSDWGHVHGAVDLIRRYQGEKPLCIYLPLGFPHPPYGVEEPYYSLIDRTQLAPRIPSPNWEDKPRLLRDIRSMQRLQNWTEDRFDELRATYLGMCARIDAQFGMILEALKEAGMYEDTAVFFFSDHGDFTGDYGLVEKTQNTFEDCLCRVPFLIKPPSGIPFTPGIRDALVELVDFPATVEAMTGITLQYSHFGRSLLPLLEKETSHRDAVFCEGGRLDTELHASEQESIPDDPEMSLYWPRMHAQTTDPIAHTKATMCRTQRYKYVRRLYEKDELYDLALDPQELVNRIEDPAYVPILLELKERMLTFYQETADVVPWIPDQR